MSLRIVSAATAAMSLLAVACGETRMNGSANLRANAESEGGAITGYEFCLVSADDEACASTAKQSGTKPEFVKLTKNGGKVAIKLRALTAAGTPLRALTAVLSVGLGSGEGSGATGDQSNASNSSSTSSSTTTTTATGGVIVGSPECFWDPWGQWICGARPWWWSKYCALGYYHPYYSPYYCGGAAVIPGQTTTVATSNSASDKNSSASDGNTYKDLFGKSEDLEASPILATGKPESSRKTSLSASAPQIALMPALVEADGFAQSPTLKQLTLCIGSSAAAMVCTKPATADGKWVESDEIEPLAEGGLILKATGE